MPKQSAWWRRLLRLAELAGDVEQQDIEGTKSKPTARTVIGEHRSRADWHAIHLPVASLR
jgi:hypothetical protein